MTRKYKIVTIVKKFYKYGKWGQNGLFKYAFGPIIEGFAIFPTSTRFVSCTTA